MNIYPIIFITLIAALIASLSQLMYKRGLSKRIHGARELLKVFKNRWIIGGIAGYLVALAVYLYALNQAALSIVYPTFASTFIFIALLSAIVLKERVSRLRALGIVVIFAGIVIVAMTF
ncbi:MAG: EamA family transporter [Candidatus Micrarchaeota archaeon]|nr:EamA family transporter [Candidatus Micrarchaeota archaeon]